MSVQVESLLAAAFFRHQVTRDPLAAFGVESLSYYRTTRNKEVDFLVGSERAPFESRYTASPTRSDAAVMAKSFGKGVLVTESTLDLRGPVAFVPAALLLAMLA